MASSSGASAKTGDRARRGKSGGGDGGNPLAALFGLRRRAEDAANAVPDLMAAAERAAAAMLSGEHAQRKSGSGEKFWQFREYDPSDRPQDIDWRQSAKGDRLYIRQKEWQTTQTTLLWVQNDAGMHYNSDKSLPTKFEDAAVIALGLSIVLTRADELVALLDGVHRPARGERSLSVLAEDMMRKAPESLPHPALRHIPQNSSVVLIGDCLSDLTELRGTIDGLAARATSGMVIQVLDPAEIDLPFSGRVIFDDPAHAEPSHHVAQVDAVRAGYRERIEAHRKGIEDSCRRHGWHAILHRTDSDIRDTLFKAWKTMSAQASRAGGRAR